MFPHLLYWLSIPLKATRSIGYTSRHTYRYYKLFSFKKQIFEVPPVPVVDALLHVVPAEDAGILVDHRGQALQGLGPHLSSTHIQARIIMLILWHGTELEVFLQQIKKLKI